jgi:hypothetical protein
METDKEWQTGKRYLDLSVENETPSSQPNRSYRKSVV